MGNSTHATGKRRAHITSDVEQLVCAAYEDRVATCQCVQCGLFYSDEGFLYVHALTPLDPTCGIISSASSMVLSVSSASTTMPQCSVKIVWISSAPSALSNCTGKASAGSMC